MLKSREIKKGASLPRQAYVPRIIASFMGFLLVVTTTNGLNINSNLYAIAFFQGFLWPHMAFSIANASKDKYSAEHRNMLGDSFLGALWLPFMSFNPISSLALISALTMNNTCAGGFKLLRKGVITQLIAVIVGSLIVGVRFENISSTAVLLASLPIFLLYPIAVGNASYRNSLALYKQKKAYAQLSRYDGLTGLHNRAYWQWLLESEFSRCRRYTAPCSLIMLDVDFFKKINDQYGHSTGDDVLRRLSNLIQDNLRDTDIAGRYGGEEFAIILPNTSLRGAEVIAERLRLDIANTRFDDHKELKFTSSLGIADFHESLTTHEQWIERADNALYQAKNSGRNQTKLWQPKEKCLRIVPLYAG